MYILINVKPRSIYYSVRYSLGVAPKKIKLKKMTSQGVNPFKHVTTLTMITIVWLAKGYPGLTIILRSKERIFMHRLQFIHTQAKISDHQSTVTFH